jgi:hypothetical protein
MIIKKKGGFNVKLETLIFRIDSDLKKNLKVECAAQRITIQQVIVNLINDFLKNKTEYLSRWEAKK